MAQAKPTFDPQAIRIMSMDDMVKRAKADGVSALDLALRVTAGAQRYALGRERLPEDVGLILSFSLHHGLLMQGDIAPEYFGREIHQHYLDHKDDAA